MTDATDSILQLSRHENIVFNNHVWCINGLRLERACFHCETLYLLGEIELQDVKRRTKQIMTEDAFKMRVCSEHYFEHKDLVN